MGKDMLKFSRREFLNKPGFETNGNLFCSISHEYYDDEKINDPEFLPDYLDIQFGIADCSRTINLDFDSSNKPNQENSIYKAQVIIDTVTAFRDAMIKEFDEWEKIEKLRKKENGN